MHPAIRGQEDIVNQDVYSLESGLDASSTVEAPDMTRQEFKQDADINYILSRFGVNAALTARQPQYGEVDYNLDLHQALNAVRTAREAHDRMPDHIRQRYPSWQDLVKAVETGTADLTEPKPDDREPSPKEDTNK